MANRYWVGGTGSWNGSNTVNWSATSGGAGGASIPTAADDVFFNASSGTGTATVSASRVAKSINCTGYTGTLDISSSSNLTLSGSATFSSGMTFTTTGISPIITFNATATLTSAGKTLCGITVNGAGITVTLADALTVSSICTTTLTAGTLALANFTLSTGIFSSSGSSTRAISFGAGNINLTSTTAGTTILSVAVGTNLSWTGTGGFVRNQVATATMSWGSTNFTNGPNLTVNAGSAALTLTASSYFKTTNFTGSTCDVASSSTLSINFQGNITLASGGTYTSLPIFNSSSNTITSNGRSIRSLTVSTVGTTVTLADALTTVVSVSHTQATFNLAGFTVTTPVWLGSGTSTRVLAFGSGGNIVLNSSTPAATILSIATATGFTWTGTGQFTRNMVATATVVFGTTGGTTSNAPNLTVNNGASDLTISSGSYLKNVDFTGSTSIVTATYNACGNLTLASGGTYTSVQPTFLASGTLTSVGRTLGNTTVNGSGITVTLADAMTSNNTLTLTQGTFDAANFNVTTLYFSSNNSNTRTLNMGTGTWTVSGGSAFTTWNAATSTNLTVNASTSTITMTNASTKTFAGGGKTYYNLNQGGAGALTISGSNTFNNITNSTQPATVTFTAGTTQTVSAFGLSGTAGNLITINSTTPGSQFTLSDASGTINAQYLAIQDSNATGGAVWNALYSTNLGNNTGWIFPGGNMFLMFM